MHNKFTIATMVACLLCWMPSCGSGSGDDMPQDPPPEMTISLTQIGRIGLTDGTPAAWDESAAEIVAFDPGSNRIFVVNANDDTVNILNAADPTSPSDIGTLDLTNAGVFTDAGAPNSVAVANGIVAVAVENDDKQMNGWVYFYTAATGAFLARKDAGALPDMVTFTPDGQIALAANEGEPNADYSIDPEGSVTYIDISGGVVGATPVQIEFTSFNANRAALIAAGVRIFGNAGRTALPVTTAVDADPAVLTAPGANAAGMGSGEWFTLHTDSGDPLPYQVDSISGDQLTLTTDLDGDSEIGTAATIIVYRHDGMSTVAQDVEPEYIAVSEDGTTAYVTLQENNALAVVDLATQAATAILPLGTKDHSAAGNEIDASDRDGAGGDAGVDIASRPVRGMYMPDSIVSFAIEGETYLITANEGDAREYDAFVEEIRFKDAMIDPAAAVDSTPFGDDAQVGRLVTTLTNDTDGDGDFDTLHCFGARSFSVWDGSGALLFDSGSAFANVTSARFGSDFNNDNDETDGDSRSDAKGCEPEAAAVGTVGSKTYAFIGLERMGGIMVYNVSTPAVPEFIEYVSNRDVSVQAEDFGDPSGDYGPEGFDFVPADESPNGKALLIVGSEVSGTVTIYEINEVPLP